MDIELVFRVMSILSLVVGLAAGGYSWMNNPGRKIEASVNTLTAAVEAHKETVRASLKEHDRRIQKVEDTLEHLPTSDEFSDLQNSVTKIEGDTKLNSEMLHWLKATVQSMDNYLRTNR